MLWKGIAPEATFPFRTDRKIKIKIPIILPNLILKKRDQRQHLGFDISNLSLSDQLSEKKNRLLEMLSELIRLLCAGEL